MHIYLACFFPKFASLLMKELAAFAGNFQACNAETGFRDPLVLLVSKACSLGRTVWFARLRDFSSWSWLVTRTSPTKEKHITMRIVFTQGSMVLLKINTSLFRSFKFILFRGHDCGGEMKIKQFSDHPIYRKFYSVDQTLVQPNPH